MLMVMRDSALRLGPEIWEKLVLLGLHFDNQLADFTHRLLPLPQTDELKRPGSVTAAAQSDHLTGMGDFSLNQRLKNRQPSLLVGIFLRQSFRRLERFRHRCDPGLIGLQKHFVA
jgi:hypothetical protein